MKNKYVPIEKQSKKKQKEYHALQRKTWGTVNPATKKLESKKIYNRKKLPRPVSETHPTGLGGSFFVT